ADVFEAVVSISIYDQAGRVIASSFTMATCGTGCRGDYSTDVRYDVDRTQAGSIRVYEVSAKDGSPINVVEIPVTLTA
ncbi:MAG TPA: Gmad2 immunoglobulin-like domain-containing protein, partial [Actinomycetota bacterium]|nr:Gmad2 immunoglobulin-like domain-containing protein [Actinomycetota bacterium]